MERPFEEEVKNAVWMMDVDKVLGPDGFMLAYYKKCWEVSKRDLLLVFKNFYEKCFLYKESNATYIALIPKREGADQLSDYKLVSLVGNTYKIIAKCLVLRRGVSEDCLKEQGAFLQGRSMAYRVLCANGCIDAWICEGIPGVMYKLDLEKTYDHVN